MAYFYVLVRGEHCMERKTLLKSNLKSHRGTVLGVFVLILLVSLSLGTVLTVWNNSDRYVNSEMDRLGYGDLTAWVSGLSEAAPLAEEISALDVVDSVGVQSLIFSEYEIGNQESDSEGQLILYEPERYPYKFFIDDLTGYGDAPKEITPGEIYASASMVSMFGVRIGDSITFPIARSGGDMVFTVAGFFEDPFMGSSMIGMKSFLISGQDHEKISEMIRAAGADGLAREGFMLHVFQSEDGSLAAAQFNAVLNQSTSLTSWVEFTHSREAISGFMLTLQNVFTSLLLAFVGILILASMAVLSHSIGSTIEQDYTNMGILKTMGFTSGKLRRIQLLQYLITTLCGMAAGMLLSIPAAGFICQMTVTTTGLLIPSALPASICLAAMAVIFSLLMGFVWLCTGKISRISPVSAIRGNWKKSFKSKRAGFRIQKKGLSFWLALRRLFGSKRRYIGACLVAVLLVFFASLIGRVDAWLGPGGEGLMDAFNPADLHIAAQPMGETSIEQVEQTIERYTAITDSYLLGMPNVSVNGVDMTANVITEPERFHLLSGQTCREANEVVLTEFVAADLGVRVGDPVTVAGVLGSREYVVSGIYQCANDMGMNIGMNREGYALIGEESPTMWCTHYFLADPSLQPEIMQALQETYGGDVYLHENSWPGLYGILSAMQLLMIFLYAMVILFVLVVTLLTAGKLLRAEQKDLSIYRTLGFSAGRLRRSFALRFGMIALLGSILGTILSVFLTDPLVAVLMRMEGISNFSSQPRIFTVLLPGIVVIVLFLLFADLAAGKIRKTPLASLPEE